MVTLTNPNNVLEEPNRWVGLSFDTKPTTAHNGDEFIEMDTSKQYMYDEEASDWVEITVSSGGGGGGAVGSLVPALCIPNDYSDGDVLDEGVLTDMTTALFENFQIVMVECSTGGDGSFVAFFVPTGNIISSNSDYTVSLDYMTGVINISHV